MKNGTPTALIVRYVVAWSSTSPDAPSSAESGRATTNSTAAVGDADQHRQPHRLDAGVGGGDASPAPRLRATRSVVL